jgi:hypothetical protein
MHLKRAVTKPVKDTFFERDPEETNMEKIQAEYKVKQYDLHTVASPREALRAHIMKMSLFPNIYNKQFVTKYSD